MLFRGTIVGAASGKMGSMVASHNKGGQYLRARVTPSGAVASPAQATVRNSLAALAAAWGTELSAEQRSAWEDYALNVPGSNALGDSIQLSGQNWYIACNVPRLQASLARVDDAPTTFDRGTPSLPGLFITQGDSSGTIGFGSSLTMTGNYLLYQGRPYNIGRNKYYGSYQLVTTASLAAGATGFNFTSAFPIDSGVSQQAYRLQFTRDDGRLSTPLGVTFQP